MIACNGFKPSIRTINMLNAGFGSMLISKHIPADNELYSVCAMVLCRGLLYSSFQEGSAAANISTVNNYYYSVKADNYFINKVFNLNVAEAGGTPKRNYGEHSFLDAGTSFTRLRNSDSKKKVIYANAINTVTTIKSVGNISHNTSGIKHNANAAETEKPILLPANISWIEQTGIFQKQDRFACYNPMRRKDSRLAGITRNAKRTDVRYRAVHMSAAHNKQILQMLRKIHTIMDIQAVHPLQFTKAAQILQPRLSPPDVSTIVYMRFNIPAAGEESRGGVLSYRRVLQDKPAMVPATAPFMRKLHVIQKAYVERHVQDIRNVNGYSNTFTVIFDVNPEFQQALRIAHTIPGTRAGDSMTALHAPKEIRRLCSKLSRCLRVLTLKQHYTLKTERSYCLAVKTLRKHDSFALAAERQAYPSARQRRTATFPHIHKYLFQHFGAETISHYTIQKAGLTQERRSIRRTRAMRIAKIEFEAEPGQHKQNVYEPRVLDIFHNFYSAATLERGIKPMYRAQTAHDAPTACFAYRDFFGREEHFAHKPLIAYIRRFIQMNGLAFSNLPQHNNHNIVYAPSFVRTDRFAFLMSKAYVPLAVRMPRIGGASSIERGDAHTLISVSINMMQRVRRLTPYYYKVKALKQYDSLPQTAKREFFLPAQRERMIQFTILKYQSQYFDTKTVSFASRSRVTVYKKMERAAYIYRLTAAKKDRLKLNGGLLKALYEKRCNIMDMKQLKKLIVTARLFSSLDYQKRVKTQGSNETEHSQINTESIYRVFPLPLNERGKNETELTFNQKIGRGNWKKPWSNHYSPHISTTTAVIESLNLNAAVSPGICVATAPRTKKPHMRAVNPRRSLVCFSVNHQRVAKSPTKTQYKYKMLLRRLIADKLIIDQADAKQTSSEYPRIGLFHVSDSKNATILAALAANASAKRLSERHTAASPILASPTKKEQAHSLYRRVISAQAWRGAANLASETILVNFEKLYGVLSAEKRVHVQMVEKIALSDYAGDGEVPQKVLVNKRVNVTAAKNTDTSAAVNDVNSGREYVYSASDNESSASYADSKHYGSEPQSAPAPAQAARNENTLKDIEVRLNEVSNAVNAVNVNYIYESVYEKIERRLRNERRRYGM